MFVFLAVALAWTAVHEADIPDTAPAFRVPGQSIIRAPEPAANWVLAPVSDAIDRDTQRHAQRGDAWPER